MTVNSTCEKTYSALPYQLRIGCSGWQYRHWRGEIYPAELAMSSWFAHYATRFDTVEINYSFYRLPSLETFTAWRAQAPPGFLYAVKASRFLTHMKKLKDPDDPLRRFFEPAAALGPTLGPVLFQLPPRFGLDLDRLDTFLEALARVTGELAPGVRAAIEFRDPSWYDARVSARLEAYGVSLCLHDMPGSATGRELVGPFAYVRFHGGASRYGGRYDDARLDGWADWLAERLANGVPVFAYFNNDIGGHAPRDAERLRMRVRERMGRRRGGTTAWALAQAR